MTTRQQISEPVKTQPLADGVVRPRVATEEALRILDLKPVPTVWGRDNGRPIYDRLPAESQQYQKAYDRDQVYVYLDPRFGKPFGAGSLQVGKREEDFSILFVESGELTSSLGQIKVGAYEVDISELNFGDGLTDGTYQVGYTIALEIPETNSVVPGYSPIRVVDSSLAEAAIAFEANAASEYHRDYFAISESNSWWPGSETNAGDYYPGSWYVLDFRTPVKAEKFTIESDPTQPTPTASLSVYYSDDAILWYKKTQVAPTESGWEAEITGTEEHRYWRFFFWDGTVSIKQILYTGVAYFPDLRVTTEVPTATPYIDNFFEEIEGEYILLASFEVKNDRVQGITDYRRISTTRYDPVASWLTSFQDENVRCLFDDVEHYSTKFLAPPTADYHFYEELDDSACFGLGEIDLDGNSLSIIFPDIVQLEEDGTNISVAPEQVILVEDPDDPSDLATRVYANDYLRNSWSLDNGLY